MSAKPTKANPNMLQNRDCWMQRGIVWFSGGLKQLLVVFDLVMQSPEFLIVGVPFWRGGITCGRILKYLGLG